MKSFQTILVLISLLLITNCGAPSQKVNINTVKKENKLPEPDFLIPEAQYLTAGQGEYWNLKQFCIHLLNESSQLLGIFYLEH